VADEIKFGRDTIRRRGGEQSRAICGASVKFPPPKAFGHHAWCGRKKILCASRMIIPERVARIITRWKIANRPRRGPRPLWVIAIFYLFANAFLTGMPLRCISNRACVSRSVFIGHFSGRVLFCERAVKLKDDELGGNSSSQGVFRSEKRVACRWLRDNNPLLQPRPLIIKRGSGKLERCSCAGFIAMEINATYTS
jgi:hypothetical protein